MIARIRSSAQRSDAGQFVAAQCFVWVSQSTLNRDANHYEPAIGDRGHVDRAEGSNSPTVGTYRGNST